MNDVEIRYEGFVSGGIGLIVEALTDNRNRTSSHVKSTFDKYGGNIGENGSVSFMFDRVGIIQYSRDVSAISEDEMLYAAADCGASEIESDDLYHLIYAAPLELSLVLEKLVQKSEVTSPDLLFDNLSDCTQ